LNQSEFQVPVSQALALFAKLVRKVSLALNEIQKAAVSAELPLPSTAPRMPALNETGEPLPDLEEELEEAGEEVVSDIRAKQKEFIESLDISQ
jgi:N-acetyltransferase 10